MPFIQKGPSSKFLLAMIPDTHRREWDELLLGKSNPKLTSLSLKLKVNSLKIKIKSNKITLQEAKKTIYEYCSKNPKIYEKDLKAIFKNNHLILKSSN